MEGEKQYLRDIKERMKGYEYGRHNLISGDFKIVEDSNSFNVKSFYSGRGKKGVCNEQHENFILDNLDLNLVRVVGSEPKYFNDSLGKHYFLLGFDKKLSAEFYNLSKGDSLDCILDKNPFVIDVSFGVAEKLFDTDYVVSGFLDGFNLPKDSYFSKGISRIKPIGMVDSDLVYLGVRNEEFVVYSQNRSKSEVLPIGRLEDLVLANEIKGPVGQMLKGFYEKCFE